MALGDLDTRWKNPQGSTPEQLHLWAQDLIKELRKGEYLASGAAVGSVTNAQLADMPAWAIKLRNADTAGVPQDVTIDGLTAETTVNGANDYLPFWDKSTEEMRKGTPDAITNGLTQQIGSRLLTSGTVSGVATLDIVLTSYTNFRAIKFLLTSFVPATDDVELWMRLSTNGGSSYDAGASDYSWAIRGLFNNAASADAADAADDAINIGGFGTATFAISNVASEGGIDAEVTLFNQTATGRMPRVSFQSGYYSAQTTNGTAVTQSGCGARLTAQDTDAVRFLFESGNITSGNYAVYGLI